MPEVPFAWRVALVVALMLVGAAVDIRRNGRAATRPREYALVLAGAAIGSAFALACDAVTSTLSPAFFIHGKGIDEGPGFTRGVVELALQAGSFAGVVVMGALLVASQPSPTRRALAPREAITLGLRPLACALLVAPLGGLVARTFDPLGLARWLDGVVDAQAASRFVLVFGIHAGLYVGALAGLVATVIATRRRTRISGVGHEGQSIVSPTS